MQIITRNNYIQIAQEFQGVLNADQVFDNIASGLLVVCTAGEGGYTGTTYTFDDDINYHEARQLAEDMSLIANKAMDKITRFQIIMRAVRN